MKFDRQRTQPAVDLASRIPLTDPASVLDVGCGPGNSTAVLRARFPGAALAGADVSPEMLQKARAALPDVPFHRLDVRDGVGALGRFDVIFSNACLQWVPDHPRLIPLLMEGLTPGGVLAVQMPNNGQEPLYQMMDALVQEPRWGFHKEALEANQTLPPEAYYDLLAGCTARFDLWETVYYQRMPSVRALVEWVKGARLRPYLNALDAQGAAALEAEVLRGAAELYRPRPNGEVLFPFRRLFWVAVREA